MLRLAACTAVAIVAGCGGGDDAPAAGPVATRDDALRAASVVLGLHAVLDPSSGDLVPFPEPRVSARSTAKAMARSEPEVSECDLNGKRVDRDTTGVRNFTLFRGTAGAELPVDGSGAETLFADCQEEYAASDFSSGNLTRDGFLETGSGLDDQADSYAWVVLGRDSRPYSVRFDELDESGTPVGRSRYTASGVIENGDILRFDEEGEVVEAYIESRFRNLSLSFAERRGAAATQTLQARLGTPARSFSLKRDEEGGVRIEGPLTFTSTRQGCVGGELEVETRSPLQGDAGIVAGEIVLSSLNVSARLKFREDGGVDIRIGDGAAQTVSAEEFESALADGGC
ncbi:hypothetical protein D0B54_17450 [Solimonas sp. K1W22B-7]|nr:hypothetical protein D0B54_17450 [Solimonas sp. K1W22B-7]